MVVVIIKSGLEDLTLEGQAATWPECLVTHQPRWHCRHSLSSETAPTLFAHLFHFLPSIACPRKHSLCLILHIMNPNPEISADR